MSDIRDRNEAANYIAVLVDARLQDRQSDARHVALYALGWCLFGLALWVLITLVAEAGLVNLQLSSRYWVALIPLFAGIVSFWTAFRHDRELREVEQRFLNTRIDALVGNQEHIG